MHILILSRNLILPPEIPALLDLISHAPGYQQHKSL